jgi:ribonuclease BN (tRNA processing enzyme)
MTPPPGQALSVIILGSGTCVPSLVRSACAALVITPAQRILLDVGHGTLRRLIESGNDIAGVDRIFLSHFHPDHTGELATFLFASKYPDNRRRERPLHLAGGPGMADFHRRLEALYGRWIRLEDDRFQLTEWPAAPSGPQPAGDLTVETAPVAHNPESVAIRLSCPDGPSVVYSGDTAFCDALVDLARGADMLICEAAAPAGETVPGHMSPAAAGETAARAGVGHLVLTHFYPECDRVDAAADARRSWSGPLTLAADLLHLNIPAPR